MKNKKIAFFFLCFFCYQMNDAMNVEHTSNNSSLLTPDNNKRKFDEVSIEPELSIPKRISTVSSTILSYLTASSSPLVYDIKQPSFSNIQSFSFADLITAYNKIEEFTRAPTNEENVDEEEKIKNRLLLVNRKYGITSLDRKEIDSFQESLYQRRMIQELHLLEVCVLFPNDMIDLIMNYVKDYHSVIAHNDGMLSILDLETNTNVISTVRLHRGTQCKFNQLLKLNENLLVTGCGTEIKVWNLSTFRCVFFFSLTSINQSVTGICELYQDADEEENDYKNGLDIIVERLKNPFKKIIVSYTDHQVIIFNINPLKPTATALPPSSKDAFCVLCINKFILVSTRQSVIMYSKYTLSTAGVLANTEMFGPKAASMVHLKPSTSLIAAIDIVGQVKIYDVVKNEHIHTVHLLAARFKIFNNNNNNNNMNRYRVYIKACCQMYNGKVFAVAYEEIVCIFQFPNFPEFNTNSKQSMFIISEKQNYKIRDIMPISEHVLGILYSDANMNLLLTFYDFITDTKTCFTDAAFINKNAYRFRNFML